ncbi:MAG: hypothetical protein M3548_13625, partial [Actinomycetota bacterium]|nr:hypothetical protein [Actinomycetota bacterium]
GFLVERLHPAAGPYLALIAMVALTVTVWRTLSDRPDTERQVLLESGRLHRVSGVLGLLTGAAAVAGAVFPQLVATGVDLSTNYSGKLLAPAGLLVLVLAVALLVPRAAGAIRPAFAVALLSVPFAAAAAFDAAFTATGVSGAVRVGPGVLFTGLALVLAFATAVAVAIAGGAERDDVDLTERQVNLTLAAPVTAAALFAVGAFSLPAVRAADLRSPGIWSDFRFASWGLLIALVGIIAVAAVALSARPPRAAAMLLGAAGVVGVRLLEYPLTEGRAAESFPGQGMWLALACVVTLVVSASVAAASRRSAPVETYRARTAVARKGRRR